MTPALHNYQLEAIKKILCTPYCGLFLDMGLGKTLISLTAVSILLGSGAVKKVLIIAPKKVAEATWTAEAGKWDTTADLQITLILGTAKQRQKALEEEADLYITNRDNTKWLVDSFGCPEKWPFDMVIIDESSSFKNGMSKRFKALRSVRPYISRVILLTGTPSPNSLLDLWAQIYLLDQGVRLGKWFTQYRDRYFVPDKRSYTQVYTWKPRPSAPGEIEKAINDICYSMSAADYLNLPEMIIDNIIVELNKKARETYDSLEEDAILQITDGMITAASAAVLIGKLAQLANGAVYDSETGKVIEIHDCKIEALLETLEQLGEEHAVIYYHYRHDCSRIKTALKDKKKLFKEYKNVEDADAWNKGEINYLLAQPASCGYGLNLQTGGHHIIWFGLTWSLEEYLQANKRLHRQGQKKPVIVHRLIVKETVDETIITTIETKDGRQAALMDALSARIKKADRKKEANL